MTLKEFIKSLRVGDAKKFAARLGVSPSYLSQMASGRTAISPTRALMIESATEGQVS
ncbi:helix-turn-helix domain-containing protein, partial [Escherichia coli]|nr:helix-turn-helix domain-containing protein [Escherichia coli]EEX0439170.1 helix-turn-helix domain-containing protein [Escherichia coli]EFB3429249.1 helix-turn-helix domain-containing protein [Escherichia coli]EFD7091010.1 helix-turn-helix domain-containing protein [Escherichia coli]EJT3542775.1 helix-turn-helix domain-containing protein [Escherichia coli]